MCDGCGRGDNEFAGRVQNNQHAVSAFAKMAMIFLEIVEATASLDTLHCRLREGCHCGRLPSH